MFYKDTLRFTEIEKPRTLQRNGDVWFQSGNVHLHIRIEDPFVATKKGHSAFQV